MVDSVVTRSVQDVLKRTQCAYDLKRTHRLIKPVARYYVFRFGIS